jgi:hypothetical protein
MVKIVCLSMAGIWHGQNRLFHHVWKTQIYHCQNRQFQHGWNVSWLKMSVPAGLEYVMVKIVRFSMAEMCHGQYRQFPHDWMTGIYHVQN